ncbi:hypothetical protein RFI_19794, partial [Reticulomyxa filosa]
STQSHHALQQLQQDNNSQGTELKVHEMVPLEDETFAKISKFDDDVRCLDFSPYGDFLATGCVDHNIKLLPLPSMFNLSEVNITQQGQNFASTPIPPEFENDIQQTIQAQPQSQPQVQDQVQAQVLNS